MWEGPPRVVSPPAPRARRHGRAATFVILALLATVRGSVLSAGSAHTCTVRTDSGRLVCWGSAQMGQLGLGDAASKAAVGDDETPAVGGVVSRGFATVNTSFAGVFAGGSTTCATDRNGALFCWGDPGRSGRLGRPPTTIVGDDEAGGSSTVVVGHGVHALQAGTSFTCGLLADGHVTCWGLSLLGRLGLSSARIGDDEPVLGTWGARPRVNLGALARSVSVGAAHACALRVDGRVVCWGENSNGQLGLGHTNRVGVSDTPALSGLVPLGASRAAQLSLGSTHTCVSLVDASVVCWGAGSGGRLGNAGESDVGDNEAPLPSGQVPLFTASLVATGGFHTCAIENASQTLYCWGQGSVGQLGTGASTTKALSPLGPVAVGSDGTSHAVASVAAGDQHTCVIRHDDRAVVCFGLNGAGQLGYGIRLNLGSAQLPSSYGPVPLPAAALEVAAGTLHTCVVLMDHRVLCFGDGSDGRLGNRDVNVFGDNEPALRAGFVDLGTADSGEDGAPAPIAQLSLGRDHSCALRRDTRDLLCWGSNQWGQRGSGQGQAAVVGDDEAPAPAGAVDLGSDAVVVQVDAGNDFTCSLLMDGSVTCWGYADAGRLGLSSFIVGDDESPASQVFAVPLRRATEGPHVTVAQLAVGSVHACALRTDGLVFCWGANGNGQLGLGHTNDVGLEESPVAAGPVALGFGGRGAFVAAGDAHTCVVRADPTQTSITTISSSSSSSFASSSFASSSTWAPSFVPADGAIVPSTVVCFGANSDGRLGYGSNLAIGDNEFPSSAGNVTLGTGVRARFVSLGGMHSCAILAEPAAMKDQVLCWGRGVEGQLGYSATAHIGDNELVSSQTPVRIGGNASLLALGGSHSCVLRTDGRILCWGLNSDGQLGQGTVANLGDNEFPNTVPPIDLGGLASHVSAFATRTCAVRSTDAALFCWGRGAQGQLGLGHLITIGDNESPLSAGRVPGLPPGRIESVAMGSDQTCLLVRTPLSAFAFTSTATPSSGPGLQLLSAWNGSLVAVAPETDPVPEFQVGNASEGPAARTTLGQIGDTREVVVCFGNNAVGALGTAGRVVGDNEAASPDSSEVDVGAPVLDLAFGTEHACAIVARGLVRCWGTGANGRSGTSRSTTVGLTNAPSSLWIPSPRRIVLLATGSTHACALRDDGWVRCWGANYNGQLGDGSTTNIGGSAPIPTNSIVDLAAAVSVVVAGSSHACALRSAMRDVVCWGMNTNGQLGTGTTAQQQSAVLATPVNVGGGQSVVSIAAGSSHTCAVRADARLVCWGLATSGQLGYGNTNAIGDNEPPSAAGTVNVGPYNVTAVFAGDAHTCALLTDEPVSFSVEPASATSAGSGGSGNGSGSAAWPMDGLRSRRSATLGEFAVVPNYATVGKFLACWGSQTSTSLGLSTLYVGDDESPRDRPSTNVGQTVRDVGLGESHSCVVRLDRSVLCFGRPELGKLGYWTRSDMVGDNEAPATAGALAFGGLLMRSIAAGHHRACVIEDSLGRLYCWGDNRADKLGYQAPSNPALGDNENPSSLGALLNSEAVLAVTVGDWHTCAIRNATQRVQCWGSSVFGQLGLGATFSVTNATNATVLALPGGNPMVTAVAAGANHTCALTGSGAVVCWGLNDFGQLGVGHGQNVGDDESVSEASAVVIANPATPTVVATALAAGASHTCALRSDGGVVCWGQNTFGQLGRGHRNHTGLNGSLPWTAAAEAAGAAPLRFSLPVVALAAGFRHTCALLADRLAVHCWGDNEHGELGLGRRVRVGDDELATTAPRILLPPGFVLKLAAGGFRTCVVLGAVASATNGTLHCWGDNDEFELGTLSHLNVGDDEEPAVNSLVPLDPVAMIGAPDARILQVYTGTTTTCVLLGRLRGDGSSSSSSSSSSSLRASDLREGRWGIETAGSGGLNATRVQSGVWCWGARGTSGLLGRSDDNIGDDEHPTGIPPVRLGGRPVKVSAGDLGTCVLLEIGEVTCFGAGTNGLLGLGHTLTIGDDEVPARAGTVQFQSRVRAVVMGWVHACAILEPSGNPICWGTGTSGRLGTGFNDNRGDNEVPANYPPMSAGLPVIQLALGNDHSCLLRNNGTVACWGSGSGGRLGMSSTASSPVPSTTAFVDVFGPAGPSSAPSGRVDAIAAGQSFTCALRGDGGVFCWGLCTNGQCGYGSTANVGDNEHPFTLGRVSINGTATSLTVGTAHVCVTFWHGASTSGPTLLLCWGLNSNGQLGYGHGNAVGDNEAPETAGFVEFSSTNVHTATLVALGGAHSCAVQNDGRLKCWGSNSVGQLGTATGTTRSLGLAEKPSAVSPVAFPYEAATSTIEDVSAGTFHTCAIFSSGNLRCWGEMDGGRLGVPMAIVGDDERLADLAPIHIGGNAVALSDGAANHVCAVRDDGTSVCWGSGGGAQLGRIPNAYATIGDDEHPTPVNPTTTVSSLPGLVRDGVDVGVPFVAVGAELSNTATCALRVDGRLHCWGSNWVGQLGMGHTTNIGVSDTVLREGATVLPDVATQIVAGDVHTCALLGSGAVHCWGMGVDGRTGYRTTSDIASPSAAGPVSLSSPARMIAAGSAHTCVLLNTNRVQCWGLATLGQLGRGSTASIGDNEHPSAGGEVDMNGTAYLVAAAFVRTCAVRVEDGRIVCWGDGRLGELGNGRLAVIGDDESPAAGGAQQGPATTALAPGCATVAELVLGDLHSCFLCADSARTIRCWGPGISGLRGDLAAGLPLAGPPTPMTRGQPVLAVSLVGGSSLGESVQVDETVCDVADDAAVVLARSPSSGLDADASALTIALRDRFRVRTTNWTGAGALSSLAPSGGDRLLFTAPCGIPDGTLEGQVGTFRIASLTRRTSRQLEVVAPSGFGRDLTLDVWVAQGVQSSLRALRARGWVWANETRAWQAATLARAEDPADRVFLWAPGSVRASYLPPIVTHVEPRVFPPEGGVSRTLTIFGSRFGRGPQGADSEASSGSVRVLFVVVDPTAARARSRSLATSNDPLRVLECANATVVDDRTIVCPAVPSGVGKDRLVVVEAGQQLSWEEGDAVVPDALIAFEPAVVSAVSPPVAFMTSERLLSFWIRGRGFGLRAEDVRSVSVGGERCPRFEWFNSTTVRCDDLPAARFADESVIVQVGNQDSVPDPEVLASGQKLATLIPAPRVLFVRPSTGPINDTSFAVTVFGDFFGGQPGDVRGVRIGGRACASFAVISDSQLLCRIPSGIGEGLSVDVTTAGGLRSESNAFFSYEKPKLNATQPSYIFSGELDVTVDLVGSDFANDISDIGAIVFRTPSRLLRAASGAGNETVARCTALRLVDSNNLRCSGASFAGMTGGAADILLETASVGGATPTLSLLSSGLELEVIGQPQVRLASPATAPTAGGATIRVIGANFGNRQSDVLRVALGTQPCPSFRFISSTELEATVPPGAGENLSVEITTRGGRTNEPNTLFSYLPPLVLSVSPAYVLEGDLDWSVIVLGENFGNEPADLTGLTLSGLPCPSPTWVSSTEVRCVGFRGVAWDLSGYVNVEIRRQASAPNAKLQVLGDPVITQVSPETGKAGQRLLIIGENFGFAPSDVDGVTVDGIPCPVQEDVRNTALQCTIPPANATKELEARTNPGVIENLPVVVFRRGGRVSAVSSAAQRFSYLGLGQQIQERPTHVTGYRPVGQWSQLQLFWVFSEESDTDLVETIQSFDVQFAVDPTFPDSGPQSQKVDVSAISDITLLAGGLRLFSKSFFVFTPNPLFFRVRAQNVAGPGPWSEVPDAITEACNEDAFLQTHLDPADWTCAACPTGAYCGGLRSENVTARAGFWRLPWGPYRLDFASCFLPESCLGFGSAEENEGNQTDGGVTSGTSDTVAELTAAVATDLSPLHTSGEGVWRGLVAEGPDWHRSRFLQGSGASARVSLDEALHAITFPTAVTGLALSADGVEQCEVGYTGTLCTKCVDGYARSGTFACLPCADEGLVGLMAVGLVTAFVAVLGLMIRQTIRSRGKESRAEIMTIKILFTHLQTIAIAGSFQLAWPAEVSSMLSGMETASSVSVNALSLDCLLGTSSTTSDSVFFTHSLLVLVTPIILVVGITSFWFMKHRGVFDWVQAQVDALFARCGPARTRSDTVASTEPASTSGDPSTMPSSTPPLSLSETPEASTTIAVASPLPESRSSPSRASESGAHSSSEEHVEGDESSASRASAITAATSSSALSAPSSSSTPRGAATDSVAALSASSAATTMNPMFARAGRKKSVAAFPGGTRPRLQPKAEKGSTTLVRQDSLYGSRRGLVPLRSTQHTLHRALVSCIVVLFLVHMSVTKTALRLFTCTEVASESSPAPADASASASAGSSTPSVAVAAPRSFLLYDLSVDCDDPSARKFMLGCGLLFFALYALGIPFAAFVALFVRRKRLDEPHTRAMFGFLYAGFRKQHYYWETLVMIRKVCIAIVSVFFAPLGIDVQCYSAILVLVFFAILTQHVQPYARVFFNRLEMASLLTAFYTLVGGLYNISPNVGWTFKSAVSVSIVVANGLLLLVIVGTLLWTLSANFRSSTSTLDSLVQVKNFGDISSTLEGGQVVRNPLQAKLNEVVMAQAAFGAQRVTKAAIRKQLHTVGRGDANKSSAGAGGGNASAAGGAAGGSGRRSSVDPSKQRTRRAGFLVSSSATLTGPLMSAAAVVGASEQEGRRPSVVAAPTSGLVLNSPLKKASMSPLKSQRRGV